VISGTFPARTGRRLARILIVLPALVFLSGCDPDPYPSTMTYPVRTDMLVEKNKEVRDIPATWGPGELDAHFTALRVEATMPTDEQKYPGAFTVYDPTKLPADTRNEIGKELEKRFGTPADPRVEVTDDKTLVTELQLDLDTLAKGSLLYRRFCLHCHGVPGDGRGPTSAWINPPPRDYRRGLFKFTSAVVTKKSKPRRGDLLRTLEEGIEGTTMPTFKAQPKRDLEALISYVIHLSIRGSVEFYVMREALKKSDEAKDLSGLVRTKTNEFASDWKLENTPITPQPYPYKDDPAELAQSVSRGYDLFLSKTAACRECHVDFGRQSKFLYDEWGTLVRPRNLTEGVYRGGRRPVDLYYRVQAGIGPSTMPGAASEIAGDPKVIWDLVNFVRLLPYPAMLPRDVRQKVYPDIQN
jgi:mono/diheme cytochrome c family protein